MRKRYIPISLCIALLLLFGGCASHTSLKLSTDKTPESRAEIRHALDTSALPSQTSGENSNAHTLDLKVGFLHVGTISDYGSSYAQNQGRLALMEELGIQTIVIENVPEDERCMDAIQSLINDGCTVIFSCSYWFMAYTAQMAERYPDLYFFHCSGFETRENMSAYFGRMYQVHYLCGIVAGMRTETNKLGYVAAIRIPEVIRGLDAFALGVKSVNKDAKIYVKWSDTWYDPDLERELALELLDDGCDVIAQQQDSVAPQIAAEERGAWCIGYCSPMGFFAPNGYLTGTLLNWAPYMVSQVKSIADGTWEASNYWGGLKDGVVRIDELTENAAPGTQKAVDKGIAAIMDGFDVFEGPIYDNRGNLRVPAGYVLTDAEKLSMDWLVDNIIDLD